MKYTIMHVNDRAKELMNFNKKILKNFEYIDTVDFFDGNCGNAKDVLNHYGIRLDVWNPYDGRASEPLPGEYGVMVSTINLWRYICENSNDYFLALEDDILLNEKFVENLKICMKDLPKNFDFLSLHYFEGHNWVDSRTEIGSEYIHRSYNQFSAAQATLYSKRGACKLLTAIKRKGYEYTNDCFLFRQSLEGAVDGYSIKPNNLAFLTHKKDKVESVIDSKNVRNT
jgi:GR25 family glycosyltransferase involved in LPS biosynthesis